MSCAREDLRPDKWREAFVGGQVRVVISSAAIIYAAWFAGVNVTLVNQGGEVRCSA